MRPIGPIDVLKLPLALLAIIFSTLASSPAAGAATPEGPCGGPAIAVGAELAEWTTPGESSCYSIYFDRPTAWFVRAAVDPGSPAVHLELPACSRDAGLRIVDRRLDSLLLDVREAGWRSVCLRQADLDGVPVEARLTSRAVGALFKDDPNETDPDPDPLVAGGCDQRLAEKDDPNETDPDPDPLVAGGCDQRLAEKDDPNETDPDPDPLVAGGCERRLAEKDDPNETDPDPDPLVAGGCEHRLATARLCRDAGAWGAKHIPTCAPTLGAGRWIVPEAGALLRLVVADWRLLSFEVDGRADLTVRDAKGLRVAHGAARGVAGETAFEVVLAPGVYWLDASGDALRYRSATF